jgi:hypothetical protein
VIASRRRAAREGTPAAKPVRVSSASSRSSLLNLPLPIPTWALATALVSIGIVGVIHGVMRHPAPFDALPALHGLMTVGYVGFFLALVAGIGYRPTLTVMLPVVLIQVATAIGQRAGWSAQVGAELVLFGGVGLALVVLARPREVAAVREKRAPSSVEPTAAF